jgi:nitric oxide reductase subunit B
MAGQQFYFSRGGQHIGTIWGHGSYLAPDWSANFLHRMGLYLAARHQNMPANEARYYTQEKFDELPAPEQARLTGIITEEIKTNRYDPTTGELILTPFQAEAFHALQDYYSQLFITGDERMGIQSEIVKTRKEVSGSQVFFLAGMGSRNPSARRGLYIHHQLAL